MPSTKELGKLGITTGFFNSEQDRLDHILLVTTNPSGLVPSSRGSLAIDVVNSNLYQNTDGGTGWKDYNFEIDITSSVSFVHLNEPSTYSGGTISNFINSRTQFILQEEDVYTVSLRTLENGVPIRKTYLLLQNGGTFGAGSGTVLTDSDFATLGNEDQISSEVYLSVDYTEWGISSLNSQLEFNNEVYSRINTLEDSPAEENTASNVGVTGEGVFKQKSGVDLEFKRIRSIDSMLGVVSEENNIGINTTPIQERYNTVQTITTNTTITSNLHGKVVLVDNGSDNIQITVPSGISIDSSLSFSCGFIQTGTGDVSFISSGGAILRFPPILGNVIQGQYFSCFLQQRSWGGSEFFLLGDLKS